MFSNRSILRVYRPMPVTLCLAAILFLLLTRRAAGQSATDYTRDSHRPYLEMLKGAQADGASPARLGYVWAVVASSYQRSGETDAALRAYSQALPLLAKSPDSRVNYATALDNMGEAYLEMGDLTEAWRVREKAFQIRLEIDNPVDVARSHEHLAEVLLAQHRYKAAQEHAEAAAAILSTSKEPPFHTVLADPKAQTAAKPGNTLVAAYITLTFAHCMQSDFAACMQSAQMADGIVSRDFSPTSLERAHADVALGFAAWKNGNDESADQLFQTGLELMKGLLGETHPVVINAMTEYRDFLRGTHQKARANAVSHAMESAKAIRLKEACATCTVTVAALP
jgi:tetratricopeptide (TPR) repeat protein